MKILEKYAKTELIVKNSRFVSEVFPCTEQNEARQLIKSQKAKYFDSTHVVHGFILRLNREILGMSDDGEPSGTAGRPVLDVMKGSGCTNLVLTVTRWFGGTLLGTGGLVKAYGDSAKSVLQEAAASGAITEYIQKSAFSLETDYALLKTIKHQMEQFSISELKEDFGTKVKLSGKIHTAEMQLFCETIKNLSNGSIIVTEK